MEIWAAVEYNDSGCMAFARDYPGAFARGKEQTEALNKLAGDVAAYWRWLTGAAPALGPVRVAERWPSKVQLADGDTEMLLEGEEAPLLESEYRHLQGVALRSAGDFLRLYRAIPEPDRELMPLRQTFYGPVPRTAAEMLIHVAGVNAYYFSRIGVAAGDGLEMVQQRAAGFAALEGQGGYLDGGGRADGCGERWSLRKVLRRFIWHDRIHARALYRRAARLWGPEKIPNPYCFESFDPDRKGC